MNNRETTAGGSGDEPDREPNRQDDAAEAALIRKVMREQERHREGGVDPELVEADPELAEADLEPAEADDEAEA